MVILPTAALPTAAMLPGDLDVIFRHEIEHISAIDILQTGLKILVVYSYNESVDIYRARFENYFM